MEARIKEVLENIRPFLQRDGGDVEFVEYTPEKIVKVRLQGHCAGCPHAQATIKNGIEALLKDAFGEEVKAVESVQ